MWPIFEKSWNFWALSWNHDIALKVETVRFCWKKLKLSVRGHFFIPTDSGRFHNCMPVFTHKTTACFIFWAKKIDKNLKFHSVFTWNCATIKNKISEVYSWNLIFYIKQAIKSRAFTLISIIYHWPKKYIYFLMKLIIIFTKKKWNSNNFTKKVNQLSQYHIKKWKC